MVVRLSDDEIAKAHRLADASDASIADMIRTFITSAYFAKWGDATAPAPKLKFKPRSAT